MTLGKRIKIIRNDNCLTQGDFAKVLSTTHATFSKYENGAVVPNDVFIKWFCHLLNVNEKWLRTGKGEKYVVLCNDDLTVENIKKVYLNKEHPHSYLLETLCNLNDNVSLRNAMESLLTLDEKQLNLIEQIAGEMAKGSNQNG